MYNFIKRTGKRYDNTVLSHFPSLFTSLLASCLPVGEPGRVQREAKPEVREELESCMLSIDPQTREGQTKSKDENDRDPQVYRGPIRAKQRKASSFLSCS